MKKKFSRLMGVGLAVVIVTTMLVGVLPVSAGTLSWGSETIPSTTGKVIDANVINDIAIAPDGTTIYAALTNNKLYKSTDAGKTWSGLTSPVTGTTDLVAVAPDDADLIAVVDDTNQEVWISTNGGSTFDSLGVPDGPITAINDVAISRELSGIHNIAVGGNGTGGAVAQLSYFNYGAAAPAWLDAAGGDWGATISATDDILAIAFSPNFPSDRIVMAVTWDVTNKLEFQVGSFNAKNWNDGVGGYSISYPVPLDDASGFTSASISVDANYLGSDEATRVVFVGTEASGGVDAPGGIYRLDDSDVTEMKTNVAIKSVAYNTAATKLVAGEGSTGNNVYRSADPTASSPTVSGASTYKKSGVNDNTNTVIVGWSGADVVAGSAGTGGAFSVSADSGKTFNDISLVNSAMDDLADVAVSADGSMIYLVANDGDVTSLWRNDGSSWVRVFAIDAGTVDFIVRPAPDDWDVVYLANAGTQNIYYTNDGGETKWTLRYAGVDVKDLAVESVDVLYAARSGNFNTVAKSANGGFIWDSAESTGSTGFNHMIKSLGEDLVIVGSVDGYVAYSNDGNDSWTDISDQIVASAGAVQVTATGLADGDYIYAATAKTGDNVYRLEIGVDEWDDIIDGDLTADFDDDTGTADTDGGVYGLALVDGVLYASVSDVTNGSGLWRTLSPGTADDGTTWSYKLKTGIALNSPPQGLAASAGSTKLWAIDTTGGDEDLYSFVDTTAVEVPSLTGPTDGFSVSMNPQTGRALDVAFNWDRLSKSTDYNLSIALDPDFDQVVRTEDVDSSSSKVVLILGPFSAPTGSNTLEWMAGETYYWRVRAASNGPLYSNWSDVNSFTIEEAAEQLPPVIIQQPPAPVIEVPVFEMPPITVEIPDIILPAPQPVPDIIIPQAPVAPAPITPAYIWAIVIIGAILVIAVVVLIVRTRRPV